MKYRDPTKKELIIFAHVAIDYQPKMLEVIETHEMVFDDLDNNEWQQLAFDLYTCLVRINKDGKSLFNGE